MVGLRVHFFPRKQLLLKRQLRKGCGGEGLSLGPALLLESLQGRASGPFQVSSLRPRDPTHMWSSFRPRDQSSSFLPQTQRSNL